MTSVVWPWTQFLTSLNLRSHLWKSDTGIPPKWSTTGECLPACWELQGQKCWLPISRLSGSAWDPPHVSQGIGKSHKRPIYESAFFLGFSKWNNISLIHHRSVMWGKMTFCMWQGLMESHKVFIQGDTPKFESKRDIKSVVWLKVSVYMVSVQWTP